MISRINASLSTIGVRAVRVELVEPYSDAGYYYLAGRLARINNVPRTRGSLFSTADRRNWERGWDVVDYKLRHPNPEIS